MAMPVTAHATAFEEAVGVREVAFEEQDLKNEEEAVGETAKDEDSRGIFIDVPVAGERRVTGIASPNAEITITDKKDAFLGKGVSDENGRFSVALSRPIEKGETLFVADAEGERSESNLAVPIATERRGAYIQGHRHYMNPDATITRAEVAMMVARLETGKMTVTGKKVTGFKDASYGWYTTAIDIVSRKGILKGYGDNRFYPNRGMTRAEFATMLTRLTPPSERATHPFTDSSRHWASRFIGKAYNSGWVGGYKDGQFHPNRRVTRAEAVSMLNRALGRNTDAESFQETLHMEKMQSFIDVRPNHWAYYDLLDGANNHHVKRKAKRSDRDEWIEIIN